MKAATVGQLQALWQRLMQGHKTMYEGGQYLLVPVADMERVTALIKGLVRQAEDEG